MASLLGTHHPANDCCENGVSLMKEGPQWSRSGWVSFRGLGVSLGAIVEIMATMLGSPFELAQGR